MSDDDNWAKIRAVTDQLDKDNDQQFEALIQSFNSLNKNLENLGDVLLGEVEDSEDFNTYVRNLEEKDEHIFFKHIHDIEFIDLTTDIKLLAKQEGILPKDD